MNPHITRRRRSGGPTAPVVANQTIEFGQRTLADMGDAPIVNTGASIASATIDSGSTNATTHFQFDVYGGVAYLQSQVNGGLTNTPYTLNCTFTSTAGKTDTATITVNTSGTTDNGADLTKSYSVGPSSIALSWQLTDTLASTGASGLRYGDFVLLRAGNYDGTGEDVSRGVNFTGTFNPPDQFLAVNAGEPAGHKGYDTVNYSGGTINWVTLMPHSTDTVATLNRLYLNCTSGVNAGYKGMKISNVLFGRSDACTADVTTLSGTTLTDGAYLTLRNNLWDWFCVENCSFVGGQTMTGYTDIPVWIAILTTANPQPNLIVQDNYFHNVWNAATVTTGATATHDSLNIIGNLVTSCWGDTFFLKHGDNVKVNWNTVYNAKSAYLALGPFYNVSLWDSPIHKDLIHARNTSSGATNAANFQAIGNRSWRANGTAAAYPSLTSDGPSNYDGETGGAIFIESPSSTGVYTNALIEGNFLVGDSPANAIVQNTGTGYIRGNTVVSHDPGNYGGTLFNNKIRLWTGTTGYIVQANITEEAVDNLGSGSQTITPNTVISRTSGAGVLDKVSTFADAYDVQGEELPGEETFDTNFVILTTSEAYTASTPAGTYDVDYSGRNLTLPWYKGTLYMDFRGGVYQGKTAADMTVTRTTSGTSLDSAGNIVSFGSGVARITDLGLLVEEARTNSALRSEEFDNASWTKTNVTVSANSTTSPDTTTNADTLTASAGNGTVQQGVTTTAISWTFSVWLRRLTGTGNVQITMDGTTWVTQTISSGSWTRCSVTQTGVSGTSNPGIRIVTSGDAVYAFGAQAEAGAFATSYIPTTTVAVARNADNIAMTGTAFSDWFTSTTCTFFAEASLIATPPGAWIIFEANDGSTNNRYAIFFDGTLKATTRLRSGGSTYEPAATANSATVNAVTKMAMAVAVNDAATCLNGGTVSTSGTVVLPVGVNRLSIGQSPIANAYIRKLVYIPSRLSNANLQALTT